MTINFHFFVFKNESLFTSDIKKKNYFSLPLSFFHINLLNVLLIPGTRILELPLENHRIAESSNLISPPLCARYFKLEKSVKFQQH